MSHQINICFHGVGAPGRKLESGEAAYWVEQAFFERALDLIADRGNVAITFDDGNASDVTIALDGLQERGLRASFYPVAARLGRAGSVDADGLAALVGAGMTIGTHGMNHLPWRGMSDADLDRELVDAREIIAAAAGSDVDTAACPLGRYDRRVLGRLRRLGYARVHTSDRALAAPDAWLQPRFSMVSSDDVRSLGVLLAARPRMRDRVIATARTTIKRWR